MDAAHMSNDLEHVLLTEEQIHAKLDGLAAEIASEYAGTDLLLVGVLKGAVMVMADLMRALPITAPVDWLGRPAMPTCRTRSACGWTAAKSASCWRARAARRSSFAARHRCACRRPSWRA